MTSKLLRYIFILPVIIYTIFLIALPLLYIFVISFFQSDFYGGMITTFTLENYIQLFDSVYVKIFLKSLLIAVITTILCILIAYPFVLAVSHKSKRFQKRLKTQKQDGIMFDSK